MSGWDAVIVAATLFAYALVSGRLARSAVSAAMVFATAGLVLGDAGLGVLEIDLGSSELKLLAEITLALVLFVDASSIDTERLERERSLPLRLLGLGLPGTILLGSLLAWWIFPDLVVFEAVTLAVLLSPTDAALGQVVATDERLPSMVRQGLNVESGLNDGICVPLLVAALSFAEAEESLSAGGDVLVDLVTELAIAVGVGVVVGGVVAAGVRLSQARGWVSPAWRQIVPLTAAMGAYAATQELGGSGFIAAFVGGLTFGKVLGADAHDDTELTDDLGDLLSAVTFVLFGAVLVEVDTSTFSLRNVGFAVLALTVIRMGPVALSMVGSGARLPSVGFVGWFGPRGLATIVFALTVVEDSGLSGTERIVDVAMITVLLSVFAHGLSASRLTSAYVAWVGSQPSPLGMESMEVASGVHRRRRARAQ